MISLVIDMSKEDQKLRLYKVLKTLKPVKYSLDIKQFKNKRSNPQNRYYWGVIIKILSNETGFFPDEMHEHLKRKFLPVEKVIKQTGERVIVGSTTTELDTFEGEQYFEQIRIWALSELDILIPEPNEETN
jgi:hypothetical protein